MIQKFYLKLVFLFLSILLVFGLKAQDETTKDSSLPKSGKGWAIAIHGGTIGGGITLNKGFTKHFGIRLGYYSGNLNQKVETQFNTDKVSLDAKLKFGAASLLFDLFPGKSSFHFTTGLVYNRNNYRVDISPTGTQTYGLIEYKPEQIGTITFDISGANYAPYIGLGFGRTITKNRIGFGLDLGSFYHGNLTTKLETKGTFGPSNTAENQEIVQKAFEGFNWYPFLNFNLSIKISK